jgi:hypothetical protein
MIEILFIALLLVCTLTSVYQLSPSLNVLIDLDGEARAHPGANPTGIALLGMGKDGQEIPLGRDPVTRYFNASPGTEFGTVAASLTDGFVDYYLTLGHVSP